MSNILETVALAATPWYIKHWRGIVILAAVVAVSGYIALLQHRLNGQTELLKIASDELIRATAQYQDDVAHLKSAIVKQNAAITASEAAATLATTQVASAKTKASNVRNVADHQANQILTQSKPANADAAIKSLVMGVSNLQWEQVK